MASLNALKLWYSRRSPLRVDLVGDFAGKDLFAIHGEILMAHCLASAKVNYQEGFQLLHAVHAVEKFLDDLDRRGCRFHILWLDSHERLCIPPDTAEEHYIKYLLTRAILMEHLNRNRGSDTGSRRCSFAYNSLEDLRKHCNEHPIQFFLCSDGRRNVRTSQSPTADENIRQCLDLILRLNFQGYSIALMDDVNINSAKILTTVFSATYNKLLSGDMQPSSAADVSLGSSGADVGELAHHLLLKADEWANWDDGSPLTARDALVIAAISEIIPQTPDQHHLAAFLVHMSLLRDQNLAHRVCQTRIDLAPQTSAFLTRLTEILYNLIRRLAGKPLLAKLQWDVFDLIDGLLFCSILDETSKIPLGQTTAIRTALFAQKIKTLSGFDCSSALKDLFHRRSSEGSEMPHKQVTLIPVATQAVLDFTHPAFDHYFEDVKVSSCSAVRQQSSEIFREATHWHNSKKKLSAKQKPKILDKWALKRNQRLMAATKRYADSLGAGAPETIFLTNGPAASASTPAWKDQLRQKSGAAAKKAAPKNLLAKPAKTQAATTNTVTAAEDASWAAKKKELERMPDLAQRLEAAKRYESGLAQTKGLMGTEVTLHICKLLVSMFEKKAKAGQGVSSLAGIVAAFWARVISLKTKVLCPQRDLDLNRLVTAIQDATEQARANGRYQGATSIEHQLEVYGPDMERGFDSAPDPRVTFKPDAWQRKVLDAIDANKSLCVIAPTSAGKTFISFYAMKKVMQLGDEDVLVYVAPTKALVNQIAAEVQGRFKKNFKHADSRSVWAIHTRDYRVNNPTGCQVLVTVPHILQIMLLSPPNAETKTSWAHRIKRIIFDEVHCIGQADDGVVWEQLLLLAPCPIIALSATVGNPEEFVAWLSQSQKTKGHELEFVMHAARYSDLRKYIYKAPTTNTNSAIRFDGFPAHAQSPAPAHGLDEHANSPFLFVHPIASIVNRNRGTLDDMSLEARDCLMLWRSMDKHQTATFPVADRLNPSRALPPLVKKADVLSWESDLKACLLPWMAAPGSPFGAVQEDLCSQICENNAENVVYPTNESQHQVTDDEMEASAQHENTHLLKHFQLLLDLHQKQGLPAIIFNYDRAECEGIMRFVLAELKRHESKWKRTSRDWSETMRHYEKWQKSRQQSTKGPKAPRKANPEEGLSKLDLIREQGQKEVSKWDYFDPRAPLAEFSFAESRKCQAEELNELIHSLRWANLHPSFIDALRRGVGVHHAGMNRKYRQIVEMLCRRGFLTVVIATGTLALGINVPCKTVVFSADSVFLSALNYRQASGRAGRRGFDLLGNVVFNLPTQRSLEIMSSRLPDLRGQFPVSTSLVLRVLTLCSHTRNSAYSIQAAQSLLSQNLLYLGGPSGEVAVKHHLRFSIEYLRKQQLLSNCGAPLNFAGLVSHLYFTENSAFAFHSLLKAGYFHDLCADIYQATDEVTLELMLVLSHLFCRHPCIRSRIRDDEWLERVKKSSSIVILPNLPSAALEILREHNQETLGIFKNYVHTYIRQHLFDRPDNKLPFSQYCVGAGSSTAAAMAQTSCVPEIRSPFAALSGFTDSFSSIHELCSTARTGVYLEESAVPYIGLYPDDTDGVPWNAYLYDFFKHGDLKTIVSSNGIKAGNIWFHLKDFSLILATIVTSLENFLNPKAGYPDMTSVQDALDKTTETHEDKEEREEEELGEKDGPVQDEQQDIQLLKGKAVEKKTARSAKVVDSWDDEGSDKDVDNDDGTNNEEEDQWGEGGEPWSQNQANLGKVLKAFKLVQLEFDAKFKEIWA